MPEEVIPVAPVIAPAAISIVDDSSVKASPPSPRVMTPFASSISFAVNVPVTVRVDDVVVASDKVIELDPESMTILPVEVPPRVNVPILRDWIVLVEAVSDKPKLFVEAEIVAVGVPSLTPLIANRAELVACPPIAKSTVELLVKRRPLLTFQKVSIPVASQDPHAGADAPETKQRLLVEVVAAANTPVEAVA